MEAGQTQDRKSFTVRLEPEIYKGIRHLAVEMDTSLSVVVDRAIKDYLSSHPIPPQ